MPTWQVPAGPRSSSQPITPGLRPGSCPLPLRFRRQPIPRAGPPAQPRQIRLRVLPSHQRHGVAIRFAESSRGHARHRFLCPRSPTRTPDILPPSLRTAPSPAARPPVHHHLGGTPCSPRKTSPARPGAAPTRACAVPADTAESFAAARSALRRICANSRKYPVRELAQIRLELRRVRAGRDRLPEHHLQLRARRRRGLLLRRGHGGWCCRGSRRGWDRSPGLALAERGLARCRGRGRRSARVLRGAVGVVGDRVGCAMPGRQPHPAARAEFAECLGDGCLRGGRRRGGHRHAENKRGGGNGLHRCCLRRRDDPISARRTS